MNVVIWSRRFDAEDRQLTDQEARELGIDPIQHQIDVALAPTPGDAAARADVLSLHVALGPGTRALVNRDLLARMKPGAMLVNTSRGEVIDHAALADAVKTRGLRVALDVYASEPATPTGDFADPILQLPGVYGTHHIGASTDQAQEAIAAETVRIVRSFKETGHVPNVVNLCRRTPASHMLVVRHRDRPGVLAHVFDHLREGDINVQETENVVFDGAEAAIARINVDAAPNAALLERIRKGNRDILELRLVTL
jgi:D-3-phosphoglycerate dehydrogenase